MTATQKPRFNDFSGVHRLPAVYRPPLEDPLNPHEVLLESALRTLSQETYDELRQLRSFKDLSFNFPAPQTLSEEGDNRKIASADVNKLGGRWKLNSGPDVDIYILPTKFLSLRALKLTVERLFEPVLSP